MLSSVLASLLQSYLGQYLELSDSTISVGSEVRLLNVKLKESALSELGLPVNCLHGKVGKLIIKIPWFSLFTKPTILELDSLHLLVVPSTSVPYDEEKEKRLLRETKQKRLQRAEDAKRFEKESLLDDGDDNTNKGEKESFVNRLAANIIKNLEVKITRIHIRYEDKQQNSNGFPFATGITLEKLLINTKDAALNDSIQLKIFEKHVILDSLAFYWKSKANLYSTEPHIYDGIDTMFNDSIGTKEKPIDKLKYLLGPISSLARLEWCLNPELYHYTKPQVDLSITMEELCFSLTKYQYHDFMVLLQSFEYMSRGAPFKKYKARYGLENLPNYNGRWKDLWKFAFDSIYEEEVMRKLNNWSWTHIRNHIQTCKEYRKAYKTMLTLGISKTNPKLISEIRRLEDGLDEINIRIQRQLAEREADKIIREIENEKNSSGWFSNWIFGKNSNGTSGSNDIVFKKLEDALTLEEKRKLYEVIDYQENAYRGIFPKRFVAKRLYFLLDRLTITIRDEDVNNSSTILKLILETVKSSVSQRPSANNIRVKMNLHRLTIIGYKDVPIGNTKCDDDDSELLEFEYQNNPPIDEDGDLDNDVESLYDQKIYLSSSPLELIYDTKTMHRLSSVFRTPDEINLANLQQTAFSYLKEYRQASLLTLQYVIEKRNLIDVNVHCKSSKVILPINGSYDKSKNSSLIVADLGRIVIKSEPISKDFRNLSSLPKTSQNKETITTLTQTLRDQVYYKFNVSLENIQLMIALPHEDWRTEISKTESPLFLLNPTSVNVRVDVCLITNDPELSLFRVKGSLDSISVRISDYRLITFAEIIDTILDAKDDLEQSHLHRSDSMESMASALSSVANTGSLIQTVASIGTPDLAAFRRTDSVDSSTTNTNSLVNMTKITMDFHLGTVDLKISQLVHQKKEGSKDEVDNDDDDNDDDEEEEDIFYFKIKDLKSSAVSRTFDFTGKFHIGEISCQHLLVTNPDSTPLKMIETEEINHNNDDNDDDEEEEKLLVLTYRDIKRTHPDFVSVHQSTLRRLDVKFNSVHITIHQDAIMDLVNKVYTLMDRVSSKAKYLMSSVPEQTSSSPVVMKVQPSSKRWIGTKKNINTTANLGLWAIRAKRKLRNSTSSSMDEIINLKIEALFKSVTFDFMTSKVNLATMRVKDLEASLTQYLSKKLVTAKLTDFMILDTDKHTYYKKIAESLDNKVFDAKVTLYDDVTSVTKAQNASSVDIRVEASMGQVKLVFLLKFINDFLAFLEPFSGAKQVVAEKANDAFEEASKQISDAYVNATRVALDIRMDAPLIIIPIFSRSKTTLMADLGTLSLSNRFVFDSGNRCFDELHIDLKDLQLLRAKVDEQAMSNDILNHVPIIQPITFELDLRRNMAGVKTPTDPAELSVSGTLYQIKAEMSKGDYNVIMAILMENFTEKGAFATLEQQQQQQQKQQQLQQKKDKKRFKDGKGKVEEGGGGGGMMSLQVKTAYGSRTSLMSSKSLSRVLNTEEKNPEARAVDFNFKFRGFEAQIFSGETDLTVSTNQRDPHNALAKIHVKLLSVEGCLKINSSIQASAYLEDCVLEDSRINSRSNTEKRIVRLMEAKKKHDNDQKISRMIDIQYKKDQKGNQDIHTTVHSFILVGSVSYLLDIAYFFIPDQKINLNYQDGDLESAIETAVVIPDNDETTSKISIFLQIEEPDIFLVENIQDIATDSLMLNTELQFKFVSTTEGSMSILASLTNIRCYTCRFDPLQRESTTVEILQPCTLSFSASQNNGHGMRVNVNMTDLCLNVTPHSIEIIQNSVIAFVDSMTSQSRFTTGINDDQDEDQESVRSRSSSLAQTNDVWVPKPFKQSQFWFLKIDEDIMEATEENMLIYTSSSSSSSNPRTNTAILVDEQAIINISHLVIKVEVGSGTHTIPLLLLESSFSCDVENWSSPRMSVIGSMDLEVAYYNSKLALWEPVIEPVSVMKSDGTIDRQRWGMNISLQQSGSSDYGSALLSPNFDEVEGFVCPEVLPPLSALSFVSRDIMEITITKAFIGVINTLTDAFMTNTVSNERKQDPTAPFVIKNQLGKTISVLLQNNQNKGFTYFVQGTNPEGQTSVELSHGSQLDLMMFNNRSVKNWQYVSPLREQTEQFESSLRIRVQGERGNFEIPISKADQRFFPFPYRGDERGDLFGMVSRISVQNGCKFITLSSIVSIRNHYCRSVDIYSKCDSGELIKISTVETDSEFHVPIGDVYSSTYTFGFRVSNPGENIGIEFFNWKDLIDTPTHFVNVHCTNRNGEADTFLLVEGTKNEIFLENTGKQSSVSYTLDIRPNVIFKNCLPVTLHYYIDDCESSFIDPGKSSHFKGFRLGHTRLKLKIFEFRNSDWSTVQVLDYGIPELALWRFEQENGGNGLKLDLGIHSTLCHGTHLISIYSPFWMINKTGKNLTYRGQDPSNIIYHPIELENVPLMFSYLSKSFFSKRKCSIRVEDSSWSDPFTLDTIEDAGKVTCKNSNRNKEAFHIGVNINLSKSSLTKVICFTPYFMILNRSTEFAIEIAEMDTYGQCSSWLRVDAEACVPFWPSQTEVRPVVVRVSDTTQYTSPFSLQHVHSTMLMLGNSYSGLYVECRISSSETLLTVSPYKKGFAPVQLVNDSQHAMIEFTEVGNDAKQFLAPGESCYFTWLNPNGSRKLVWSVTGLLEEFTNNLESDDQGVVQINNDWPMAWVSFLDGMQRVLLFSDSMDLCFRLVHTTGEFERIDREIDVSIHGIGISLVNNMPLTGENHELLYVSITSSDVVWEYRKVGKTRYKSLTRSQCQSIESDFQRYMRERSIGKTTIQHERSIVTDDKRSVINVNYNDEKITTPVEGRLRRQFQKGLWLQLRTSTHQRQIHAKINRIQIDNQLRECLFPVNFAPVPPPKSVMADSIPKPFFELSILEYMSLEHHSTRQYKYFHVLVQECHIKIDQGMLTAIMEFLESSDQMSEDKIQDFLKEDLDTASRELTEFATLKVTQGQRDFYDYLHFSPLKVHVSFSLTSYNASSSPSSRSNFLSLFLQSLGVTITDTDDIIFRLAYFERKHIFYSKTDLFSEMVRHYSSQAIKQVYVIILGLDVIGNPFGLMIGVSRSVEDLFYEPFQGAVQGPSEFAEGLFIGVRSVFSGVIGGAAGTVSRITGALGKGLASLTFDEKFQHKRREAIKKRGRQNFGESLARSGKSLVMGIFDGVTGVALKPIEGAREEGVGGFLKGVGKGVVGLVARPTGGVVDFASGTFHSVKKVTEVNEEISRIRPARFLHPDGVVRYYDTKSAKGNKYLNDLDKGYYAKTDYYVTHEETDKNAIFLVTSKRLLFIAYNQILGSWAVTEEFLYSAITGPPTVAEENGLCYIIIKPKGEKKKIFGYFGGEQDSKKIFTASRDSARQLARTIEKFRTSSNA